MKKVYIVFSTSKNRFSKPAIKCTEWGCSTSSMHTQFTPSLLVSSRSNCSWFWCGTIDGYCVGEPWNYRAAIEGSGFTIAKDLGVWLGHPGKVLGVREDWANNYRNTHIALTKALLEAYQYCADSKDSQEVRQVLAGREYVSTDIDFIQIEDPDGVNTCNLDHPMREYADHLINFKVNLLFSAPVVLSKFGLWHS